MNLREVIMSGYKVFSRMAEDKRKAHILAVQYIEFLATQNSTRMEPWDLIEVFGTGKGNELHTDKKEINKRFFERVERLKSETPAAVYNLETRIATKIDEIAKISVTSTLNTLTMQMNNAITNANRAYDQAAAQLTEANRLWSSIAALDRKESTLSGQVTKLLQENFWEFFSLDGSLLVLHTKANIILTHKNPAASIDLRVDMGKFKANLDLSRMNLTVTCLSENLSVDGYYHPHVNGVGQICWGSAASTVSGKLPKGEVYDVFKLLESVLCSYNEGNPYRALARFQEKAKHSAPPKDPLPAMTTVAGAVASVITGVDMTNPAPGTGLGAVASPAAPSSDPLAPIVVDRTILQEVLNNLRTFNASNPAAPGGL